MPQKSQQAACLVLKGAFQIQARVNSVCSVKKGFTKTKLIQLPVKVVQITPTAVKKELKIVLPVKRTFFHLEELRSAYNVI